MEDRLNLLCEAGVIDRDICDGMKVVVTLLESHWAIPLQNDQGAMAITHMANALMRSRRGEEVNPLDAELLAEIKSDSVFGEVEQAHHALLSPFNVQLHPNEEGYLLANLFSLWLIHKS
ncbi:hypothetical protein LH23_03710 [Cedecea neteri]|uniref:PRD domain-containing protein n=1 Tax=Cedecea neteri TaxID=158822 RepID=A0AAN0S1H5_9ENTR|nr:hypothetical protein [Cedecea neteri]AIR59788.1 hypothetical protein LH23_03710 [Cedecea neteri]